MSKFILFVFLAVLSFGAVQAKDGKYTFAVMITNPLGMSTKIGGGAELRIRQTSFVANVANYSGLYAGKQYRIEVQKYLKTFKKNESFFYFKVCGGDATYDGSKLTYLNDKSKAIVGPVNYIGGGAGIGRRININHFFLMFNAGAKYVFLPPDFSGADHEKFRFFYATGPGSVIDLNLRLGLQF